jgi:uncharacterized membrane protein
MPLIDPFDNFSIIAVLMIAVAIGVVGEYRRWFGVLPGVLVTIVLGALFTSINLLPSGADQTISVPVYNFAFTYLIPFSIPLLLFNVHLKRIFRESGRLMLLFLIGAGSVFVAAVAAGLVFKLGPETHKLAAVYTATYTGGSVNFMAVAEIFNFTQSPLFAASIVVDNVFTIIFIMFLFLLPGLKWLQPYFPNADRSEAGVIKESEALTREPYLVTLSKALCIASVIVAIGFLLAPPLEELLKTELSLDVLIITILIIILANIFPKFCRPLEAVAFPFGMFMLYFFLAVIGATCDLGALLNSSPQVLLFAVVIMFFHLAIIMFFGKILKFSLEEIAIASGANIGGVSIAAPMAATFDMKKAVTPAILIGIMGYIVGTFLGIGVGLILQ